MGGKRGGECHGQRERERGREGIASCLLAGAVDCVFDCVIVSAS